MGNYCGVTVSLNKATHQMNGYNFQISDLPGIYSLSAITPDEIFTVNYLLESSPDIIINIVDASNIKRNLYLTVLLIEMGFKVVVALNMYDEVLDSDIEIDIKRLSWQMKIPIIPTISTTGDSIDKVFDKIIEIYNSETQSQEAIINYGHIIENAIETLTQSFSSDLLNDYPLSKRGLAIRLIEENTFPKLLSNNNERIRIDENKIKVLVDTIEAQYNSQSDNVITRIRYDYIDRILKHSYYPAKNKKKETSRKIDKALTNKYLGLPIFFAIIYLVFFTTFKLGTYPMAWIDMFFTWSSSFLSSILSDGSFKDLLIDGMLSGIGSVLVFLPNILILFFFISFMESTGYMARIVFIMDKIMRKIGLHGKSFIPLMMGFGCNVPAIMSSRILNNRSDRIITILVNPFMSCTARLPIYLLIIGTFFSTYAPLILFCIYTFGVLIAIVFARFFRKYLFPKKEAPFILELPPYRLPLLKNVVKDMWYKAAQYIKKIAGIILVSSIIIWAFSYYPKNISYSKDYDALIAKTTNYYTEQISSTPDKKQEYLAKMERNLNQINLSMQLEQISNSYLAKFGKMISPIMKPLGFDWKMTISILTGLAAKEVIVSTMAILYPHNDLNIQTDSLGSKSSIQHIPTHVAMAFLIFILVYFPCVSVIVIVAKETNWKWAVFVALYTTFLAWSLAFIFVQASKIFL